MMLALKQSQKVSSRSGTESRSMNSSQPPRHQLCTGAAVTVLTAVPDTDTLLLRHVWCCDCQRYPGCGALAAAFHGLGGSTAAVQMPDTVSSVSGGTTLGGDPSSSLSKTQE